VSDYAGTSNKVVSDSNYIYNNSIYVDASITPDISIVGMNTFVYNNIFYATGNAKIGQQVTVKIEPGSELKMSNNLFYGNVSTALSVLDDNPVFGDPFFIKPGELNTEAYRLGPDSKALKAGLTFQEPEFPMAGKGIFKNVKLIPDQDLYGNPVDVSNSIPHIGVYNGKAVGNVGLKDFEIIDTDALKLYPNPVRADLFLSLQAKKTGLLKVHIFDLQGRIFQSEDVFVSKGSNTLKLNINQTLRNGIYLLSLEENGRFLSRQMVLYRSE